MPTICNFWSTADNLWSQANWTWAECEMVQEICQIWSTSNFTWANANWQWSACSGSTPIPPVPAVGIANPPGVDAETLIQPWQLEEPWNPYKAASEDKRRRLIQLICKVHGKEYKQERPSKDFPVTVKDIRTVVKKVANIDLDFKMEE